ncbi:hypothetical protein LSH36_582g02010, partial [Paralvinella palmiformis]
QSDDVAPRRRRAATLVMSYKEPKIGKKLRQGDQHTSTIYKGVDGPELFHLNGVRKKNKKNSIVSKVKEKRSDSKKSVDDQRKRSALSTISNTYSSSDSS